MTVLEFVARTFSIQLPDGRFIFRPWGARGPCFLLSQQQRAVRAWIQLALYVVLLGTLCFFPAIIDNTPDLISFAVGFALLNYLVFWLFSIGLPKTDKPPAPTFGQQRTALAAHSRAVGRPVLWVFAVGSWLFALVGGAMVLFFQEWVNGLLILAFFGACAGIYSWQLWLIRKGSDA